MGIGALLRTTRLKRSLLALPTLCIACLCWFMPVGQGAAAEPAYRIDVWQADDGLPQSTVTSIAQTPDGYLWFGTQNGLVRFDGARFKIFAENTTPAIKNSRIVQLFVDHRGTLWIGAEQGNLISLRDGRFVAYAMPGNGTAFNYARALCDDEESNLWVVSCEWRLLSLARGQFSVRSADWGLSGVRPDAVASDKTGRVCVGTERELALWEGGKFRTVWSQADEAGFQVEFLSTSRAGGWWVAGNGRLRRFDSGHWMAEGGPYRWANEPIYGLYEDRQERVWVATLGRGLFRYDPDGKVLHLTTREGLPTDFVRCVSEDREGNIWAGTEGGGLCRLKPSQFQSLGVRQGLSSDQVMSVCESADHSYWIGMNGSGLDHLQEGRVEHYGTREGLMNGHVWSVVEDRQGKIWAGTWGGLFRLEVGRFENLSDGSTIGGVVLAMYEDREAGLWIGQQAFGPPTCVKGAERTPLQIAGASASPDVRVMTEDREGDLWIGTENEGLYRRRHGEFTHFGKREGLGSESVWSLYAGPE